VYHDLQSQCHGNSPLISMQACTHITILYYLHIHPTRRHLMYVLTSQSIRVVMTQRELKLKTSLNILCISSTPDAPKANLFKNCIQNIRFVGKANRACYAHIYWRWVYYLPYATMRPVNLLIWNTFREGHEQLLSSKTDAEGSSTNRPQSRDSSVW
jgi:hypothetical protein